MKNKLEERLVNSFAENMANITNVQIENIAAKLVEIDPSVAVRFEFAIASNLQDMEVTKTLEKEVI